MGAVWSARNESTDRDFALKLMLPDAAQNPVALQRFFQEAKASGRLRHRCVVEVYDLGRVESVSGKASDPHAGTPYIVMELLEGEPLDSILRRRKALPIGTTMRLVGDLARGLDVAHTQGIIHRDLKPGNIFLHRTIEGNIVPKILDFGISKLVGPTIDPIATSAGTVLGSPAYMSPEQAGGEVDVDGRSDIWSLGVMLYKCLCGNVPFQAPNYNALIMAIARNVPTPIEERVQGLPREVAAIVGKCLSKTRDGRYSTGKTLAAAIDEALAEGKIPVEDLRDLVSVGEAQQSHDSTTLPTERSAGTLVATEVEREPAPSQRPAAKVIVAAPPPSSEAALPDLSTTVRARRNVIASFAAIIALIALIIVVAKRSSSTNEADVRADGKGRKEAPLETPTNAIKSGSKSPTETSFNAAATATATGAATGTSSDSPTGAASVDENSAPKTKPTSTGVKPKPTATTGPVVVKPKPSASAKPVHEGVTSSGL